MLYENLNLCNIDAVEKYFGLTVDYLLLNKL